MRNGIRIGVAMMVSTMVGLGALLAPAPGSAFEGEGPVYGGVDKPVANLEFALMPTRFPPGRTGAATLDLGIEQVYGTEDVEGAVFTGLSTITIDLDRSIEFEPGDLPVCRWPAVEGSLRVDATGPDDCHRAVVGHGEATIRIGFPETWPKIPAQVKVYNGGVLGGAVELLIEIAPATPIDHEAIRFVAPIRRVRRGRFGNEVRIRVPQIIGGEAVLLDLRFELGRRFRQDGRPASYVSAQCPDGRLVAAMTAVLTVGITAAEESVLACSS